MRKNCVEHEWEKQPTPEVALVGSRAVCHDSALECVTTPRFRSMPPPPRTHSRPGTSSSSLLNKKTRPRSGSHRPATNAASLCHSGSDAQKPSEDDVPYQRAAAAVLEADYILVCAGAGFSADSGLPVYKDVADLEPYRARNLTYADLCTPGWCQRDPETFFGFWGSCFNSYFDTEPHEGYNIINRWRDSVVGHQLLRRATSARTARESRTERAGDATNGLVRPEATDLPAPASPGFVFTSNVDCFFRRAGWAESQILEIHGNVQRWQCSLPCAPSRFSQSPVWELESSHRFEVDQATMRAPRHCGGALSVAAVEHGRQATGASPGCAGSSSLGAHGGAPTAAWGATLDEAENENDECEENEDEDEDEDEDDGEETDEVEGASSSSSAHGGECADTAQADGPGCGGGGEQSTRNFQHCIHCGRLARPCILMFEDNAWVGDEVPGPLGRGHSQPRCYKQWENAVKASLSADRTKRLVILELGCGPPPPTQPTLHTTLHTAHHTILLNASPFRRPSRHPSCLPARQPPRHPPHHPSYPLPHCLPSPPVHQGCGCPRCDDTRRSFCARPRGTARGSCASTSTTQSRAPRRRRRRRPRVASSRSVAPAFTPSAELIPSSTPRERGAPSGRTTRAAPRALQRNASGSARIRRRRQPTRRRHRPPCLIPAPSRRRRPRRRRRAP